MSASFVPDHKASMVLFLDRVYGIENQDFLLHVLDVGFLPDMRAAASLDTVSSPTYLVTHTGQVRDNINGTGMVYISRSHLHLCGRKQNP